MENRILIDMSPVLYSNFISTDSCATKNGLKPNPETGKNPITYKDVLIFKVLEEVIAFKQQFQASEVILSFDNSKDGGYWRKLEYSRIKYGRGRSRDKSAMDWNAAFKIFEEIKEVFKNSTSMKVLDVPHMEADDHAFVLGEYFQDKGGVTLISLDGDWQHALNYKNVKLFKTRKTQRLPGIFVEMSQEELNEKTEKTKIAGDPKDGLKHMCSWSQFSPEFLVEHPKFKGREIEMYNKHHQIEKMYNDKHDWTKNAYKHKRFGYKSFKKSKKTLQDLFDENPIHKWNYERNQKLCLPEGIPEEFKTQIIEYYNETEDKRNAKELQKFFNENGLFDMLGKLTQF